jgi:2-dehydro-3-deoxyglucarate aldolase/4-hydroxy-2-oxoheptanedioate aldolase
MFEPINHLKRKLARGETTLGLWVTLESPAVTEIAVTLGLDWVVIDTEHGSLDYRAIVDHIRATRQTTTTPLVRIAEISPGIIKRVLDLGAHGIIVPQVTSAEEVATSVRLAKYPPGGIRGVGGDRATLWGLGFSTQTAIANSETMVIPLIETVAAGQALTSILDVPGVDAIHLGPADYSASAGFLGQWEGPGVAEALLGFKDKARSRGLACGILATSIDDSRKRRDQGFQMIGLGADTGLLIRSLREAIDALKHGRS